MMAVIDGADRHAGNPVRVNAGVVQRLVDAGLIGAERAAALQHQGDDFKRKVLRRLHGTRLNLSVHDNLHSELTELLVPESAIAR